ncbi:MAG: hypothetical protein Q9220_007057 [cf. Caloplaca sp. 1 TL-2023]
MPQSHIYLRCDKAELAYKLETERQWVTSILGGYTVAVNLGPVTFDDDGIHIIQDHHGSRLLADFDSSQCKMDYFSTHSDGGIDVGLSFLETTEHKFHGQVLGSEATTATETLLEPRNITFNYIRLRLHDDPRRWALRGSLRPRTRFVVLSRLEQYFYDHQLWRQGTLASAPPSQGPEIPSPPVKHKTSGPQAQEEYDVFLRRAESLRSAVKHESEAKKQRLKEKHDLEVSQLENEEVASQKELDEMIIQRTEALKSRIS